MSRDPSQILIFHTLNYRAFPCFPVSARQSELVLTFQSPPGLAGTSQSCSKALWNNVNCSNCSCIGGTALHMPLACRPGKAGQPRGTVALGPSHALPCRRLFRVSCRAGCCQTVNKLPLSGCSGISCAVLLVQVLSLADNNLTSLPATLWDRTHLRSLDLSENQLQEVPQEICKLQQLEACPSFCSDLLSSSWPPNMRLPCIDACT